MYNMLWKNQHQGYHCDFLSAERRRRMEFWNMGKITLMSKKKVLVLKQANEASDKLGSNSHFYNQNLS